MGTFSRKVNVKPEKLDSPKSDRNSDVPEVLRTYLRPLMIGTGVILTTVVFFSVGSYIKQKSMESNSDMAYFALKNNDGRIGNPEALETLNGHYRQDGAGADSVSVASLFFHDGKIDESLELYRNISENGEHNITKSIGLLGIGYSLEAKGKFQEAIEKFKEIRSMAILKDYQYLAALGVARCYEELNDTKKALEEYNLIGKDFELIFDKDFIQSKVAALNS